MRTLLVSALLLAGTAHADPKPTPVATYATVAELMEDLPAHPAAVVKLRPATLTGTTAAFYGCAFANKKKWRAITLTDGANGTIVVYKKLPSNLDPETEKSRSLNFMSALLKTPPANARCKVVQFELVSY